MTILCFTLTMPSNAAWNGKWTGDDKLYARTMNMGKGNEAKVKCAPILRQKSYSYFFGDGWVANVEVRVIDAATKAKVERDTRGFCGYEWMIDSIMKHGEIRA